jgi:uncharacterized membrane protein YqjE
MPTTPAHTPLFSRPQLPPLGTAVDLFGESVAHRAELANIEVAEAADHAVVSAILGIATVLLVLLTGFAVTLLVASLVWDSPHRAWWLLGLGLLYLAGTVATGLTLHSRLRNWHPMGETRWQLQQDYQCLNTLIKSFNP